MALVTGSRLAFFTGSVGSANKINVVLTTDGTDIAGKAIADNFNIEVFTSSPGSLAPGFQASAFVEGAQQLTNNAIQAGSPTSKEQLLDGSYTLIDLSGGSKQGENIQIIGSTTDSAYVVVGSAGDTITGSSNSEVTQYIDASGKNESKNPGPFEGPETVTGGAGGTIVLGGKGDVITGGAGNMQVNDDRHAGNQTVTGGGGDLKIFEIGQNFSITGATSGTTFIDDDYGNGGGTSIVGGSGTAKGFGGENTVIIAASTDQVTVGSALTYVNAFKGDIAIEGGKGTTTGTVEGASGYNTVILAGKGDVITLHEAKTYIDAAAGDTTITGGAGLAHIEAGKSDSVVGGSGDLEVNDIGNSDTIEGGVGNLFVFGKGTKEDITGSTNGWTLIQSGGNSSIAGGSGTIAGTVAGAGGIFDNTIIVGAGGDTITGGDAPTTYIIAFSGNEIVTAGSGATTVLSGKGDSIIGGSGKLEVDIVSDQNGQATTIDLGKGTGTTTLRDFSVSGGKGATNSVTGFSTTTDTIASATSVASGGKFLGTSASDGKGGSILTFLDGTTMTLAGITDPSKITFTS